MQVHVDDLIIDMRLEKDIKLKAGSFLITLKDLPECRLNDEVIDSIRKFSSQLVPESDKVEVVGDDLVFEHLKKVLETDVNNIMKSIEEGRDYPNFLADTELRNKVARVMEKLITNPDIIGNIYDMKLQTKSGLQQGNYIPDHSIRVTLLAIAVGLKLRWSIISLVNVGMAAVLHDLGILESEAYPNLRKLDDYNTGELEEFIEEHQKNSEKIFSLQKLNILPHTKNEIIHMLANHHRPDLTDTANKTTLLIFLAELVDEMISALPHKVRYNFSQVQIHKLGKRYQGRLGLMHVLLGLIKLFRGQGLIWEMVQAITQVFSMQELLVENYEEKLKKILDSCTFKCASPFPAGGAALPRTIYCKSSTEKDFNCEHVSQVRIEIQSGKGKMVSYLKCSSLTEQIHDLNKAGKKEGQKEESVITEPTPDNPKSSPE
jgi:hypothetical protein